MAGESTPAVVERETLPPGSVHRERVAEAIRRLQDPQIPIDKVVLARSLRLSADSPWDARTVLRRLADADPAATVYLADLSPRARPTPTPRWWAPAPSYWWRARARG